LISDDYLKLKEFAKSRGVTTNRLAREVIENYIDKSKPISLSSNQEEIIREYVRVSR
jgi:predicted DNA-binding protein